MQTKEQAVAAAQKEPCACKAKVVFVTNTAYRFEDHGPCPNTVAVSHIGTEELLCEPCSHHFDPTEDAQAWQCPIEDPYFWKTWVQLG